MKIQMTKHAQYDRFNRLSAILDHIEIGEVVAKVADPHGRDTILNLTSTGIVLVVGKYDKKLITGYLINRQKLLRIISLAYGRSVERAPQKLWDAVCYNEKHYANLFQKIIKKGLTNC